MNEQTKKISVNYGDRVAVLPGAVLDYLERASKIDLKVLIMIASSNGSGMADVEEVVEKLGLRREQVDASVEFWKNAGVITVSKQENESESIKENTKDNTKENRGADVTLVKSDDVPNYTAGELSVILERRSEASHLIDESQRMIGKMFNTHEINIVLGLVDYMGLEWDYVLAVLEYCGKIGKRSVKYAEKLALSLNDSGIDNSDALKIKLSEMEALAENEGKVRSLFGMKARALTAKEKKCIEAWFGKFGYNIDIVRRAYEITVNSTGDASVPYANAILERWNSEGLRTLEEIDAGIEKKKIEAASSNEGSFNTDDFFEAALRRSFGEQK